MTSYLLDTNIVSLLDPPRRKHTPELIAWLRRNGSQTYLSAMTIAELQAGVLKLLRKKNVDGAEHQAKVLSDIRADFATRVLVFDAGTAMHLAFLAEMTHRRQVGIPDLIIAATALQHGMTILTHNLSDFARLPVSVVDPFATLPPDI